MIMVLTDAQYVFAGEIFYKTDESVIAIERAFHAHFILHWMDRIIMVWTGVQHVFAGETILKTNESVIATYGGFYAHFMLLWIDDV